MLLAQNVCRNSVACTSRLSSKVEYLQQKNDDRLHEINDDDVQIKDSSCRRTWTMLNGATPRPIFQRLCRHYATSSQQDLRSYYEVLGVTPNCTKEKIKAAFYRLSKVYHPDVNKSEAAHIKFQEIVEAYEVLSNVKARQQYDSEQQQTKTHYREVKFGQSRYNNSGMPPQGRAVHYNYDKWFKEHYKEAFKRTKQDKQKTKEDEEEVRKREEGKTMPTPFDAKDVPIFLAAASICVLVYHFLRKKR